MLVTDNRNFRTISAYIYVYIQTQKLYVAGFKKSKKIGKGRETERGDKGGHYMLRNWRGKREWKRLNRLSKGCRLPNSNPNIGRRR